jgi:protein-tyrosine phosphatase
MYDIHSHIIYHVDDGARTLDEAVELVTSDASQGAKQMIATPHYSVEYPLNPEIVRKKLAELKDRVQEAGLEVELYPGNEVLYFDSMTEHLKEHRILTLGETRFTLIEFYPLDSYQRILTAVRKIRRAGYRPIIAHAERFKSLREHGLSEVISEGAYIQVSTEPLGRSGIKALLDGESRFLHHAVKQHQVHFLGTDMHRMDRRPPVLSDAVRWVRDHTSRDYCEELLNGNGERMLQDQDFL